MERTRIVHYIHSRTPVVLSPTSPSPSRLPSSSSMSSLASGIDDKAPLASIDIDLVSTPRRSSRSSDQNGPRSSSTGRLIDDSEICTSVYTALRCQDLPIPSDDSIDMRKEVANGDTRKERSRSDVTPPFNGNSPNISMDAAMRRHTLGSWSKSRRKPHSENSAVTSPQNTSTLPHTNSDSSSPGTLVKSRRRYTWLSSKQTVPQGPTVARPQKSEVLTDEASHRVNQMLPENTSTFPRTAPAIKSPLSPLRQQNGISANHFSFDSDVPIEYSTFPRASNAKAVPVDQHNRSIDAHYDVHRNSSHVIPRMDSVCQPNNADSNSARNNFASPKTSPSMKSPKRQLNGADDDDNIGSSKDSSRSPKIDSNSESQSHYTWQRDPRRRPCNFDTDFDLSALQSPPEPEPRARDLPSVKNVEDNVESRVEHFKSPTENHCNRVPSPPSSKRTEMFFTSKLSTLFGSEKYNSKMSNSSDSSTNSYVSYGGPDNDLTFDDKTPVNDLDPPSMSQCLSDISCDKIDVFTTGSSYENCKNDNTGTLIQSHPSPIIQNEKDAGYRDCLVRDSLQFVPKGKSIQKNGAHHDKANAFKWNGKQCSFAKKSKSVSVCSGEKSDYSIEDILKSPRTRNSFKIAVGSNWDDVFPAAESLSKLPDISEDKTLSPRKTTGKQITSEDEVFVSCENFISNKNGGEIHTNGSSGLSPDYNTESSSTHSKKLPLVNSTLIQEGKECEDYDSLNRRIKRNSMRLATASLSDLTCALDDIDISMDKTVDCTSPSQDPSEQNEVEEKTQTSCKPSPLHMKSNLSRTGSLLSSQNSSSFGSFYSCQSIDSSPFKCSPSSSSHLRKELRARLDSPLINRLHNNTCNNNFDVSFPNSSRTSSPVSIASSSRSGNRQRPAYFWTRQAPYPRLLYARSSSVASSSGGYRTSSPQPSTTSSIHRNNSQNSNIKNNSVQTNTENSQHSETNKHLKESSSEWRSDLPTDIKQPQRPSTSRPIDRRSMTLPISNPYYNLSYNYTPYTPDLSPSSVLESPNSNAVRSPPSLGRPKRKQYAGFDCQPLPMDSFMSDSSSVYTGVSCSSRATDMTGQPDNGQFDESFISEDIRSYFEEDSRGDISFDASETLQPSSLVSDITISRDFDENESKRSSIHSNSTTKQENGESSVDEKSRDDSSSIHNSSDDFIENTNDHIGIRQEKQFGSEYDALFRLYKTDDLFTMPSYSLYSQNGKAFSSSCLLRAQLYSKRKFLSTRDIFDLIKNSDKTHTDGTVSLTSLERHAHKVCEAILCCDEMDEDYINNDTHSLV